MSSCFLASGGIFGSLPEILKPIFIFHSSIKCAFIHTTHCNLVSHVTGHLYLLLFWMFTLTLNLFLWWRVINILLFILRLQPTFYLLIFTSFQLLCQPVLFNCLLIRLNICMLQRYIVALLPLHMMYFLISTICLNFLLGNFRCFARCTTSCRDCGTIYFDILSVHYFKMEYDIYMDINLRR